MVGGQFDKKDIVRIDKSSALRQLGPSLLAQFRQALWTCDGHSTGVARRAWNLLHVICRMLELARADVPSFQQAFSQNLDMCRKIFLQARSSEQNDPSGSMTPLRHMLRFTLATACPSFDPNPLWIEVWWTGNSSPEDFNWLIDYLDDVYSNDHETAGDILVLLGSMKVSCSPAKQHLFIKRLIACMDSSMPYRLRHAAIRAAHSSREILASIDAVDYGDMVLAKLSPAILTAVCPQPGTTSGDEDPDRPFNIKRDSCYLELVFALARNPNWRPHLFEARHIDRCISMIPKCCNIFMPHAFYLAGIFLRITPEQSLVTSLDSITEHQWWDVICMAWPHASSIIEDDIHCFESLPVLVEGTRKYIHTASKPSLKWLIRDVDSVLNTVERRYSEKGEGVVAAVKELRGVAHGMF
ncbi:uncharacterized protein BJ212DRAFT_1321622 [Suillus subaureus]|uniref:Uncharacterized protein n=1 Tax=Suillus subaureus TaxID=48587 RepID=A0A9P7EKK0_9AGAM|nr:uncharacterized protein BJ212DRAFT_1321622 [Suillus subaureus]KAG1824647.1 hypothetical protein BJ212DRAFT_1321622 [Suillus subaureus]